MGLISPFVNFRPESLQIRIGEGHFANGRRLSRHHGLLKPMPGHVQLVHLTGIASQVESDRGLVLKFFCGRQEGIPGLGEPAAMHAAKGVGTMQPTHHLFRAGGHFGLCHTEGFVPPVFISVQRPKNCEGIGVLPVGRGNLIQLNAGLPGAAQAKPTQGGIQVMRIRRFQATHGENLDRKQAKEHSKYGMQGNAENGRRAI